MAQEKYRHGKVVLITGTGSGIGLELAKRLYHSKFHTIVTARQASLERLSEQALEENSHFIIRPLDVTDYSQQEQLIDEINERWGGVDILINNAGVSYRSVIEHAKPEDAMDQFKTNYFGPMNLVRLVLPIMRKKRRGHIINVSSVGGMMAMPTMGLYSGSKFALEGACESLWYEVRPWNIRVHLIEPGFIHSYSFRNVRLTQQSEKAAQDPSSPYYCYYENMGQFIEKFMLKATATSDSIAKTIIKVMQKDNASLRIPVTVDAWLFYFLRRMLPRRIYHHTLYHFLSHIRKKASL